MKIKKLNMAKWIVALRTKKFAQTSHTLRNKDGYCCLGVACHISKKGKWEPTPSAYGDSNDDGELDYLIGKGKRQTRDNCTLPTPVMTWLGLEASNPAIKNGPVVDGVESGTVTASTANDIEKLNFGQIADLLEARYLPGEKAEDIVRKAKARAKKRVAKSRSAE